MTGNDGLIDRLALELVPVRPGAVAGRLALGALVGAVVSLTAVAALLGLRPDFLRAVLGPMFWIKLGYTAALAGVGLWAAERLARPTGRAARRLRLVAVPIAAMAILAAARLMDAPNVERRVLVMGASARACPWLILASAVPVYIGLCWAIRGLAPTRLRAAGFAAGLCAGGTGAFVYALHCPEAAAPFIALWYTLGVLLAGAAGALAGPVTLRWTDPPQRMKPPSAHG